jgi:hypothetical protein
MIGALLGFVLPATGVWLTMRAWEFGRVSHSSAVVVALAVCGGLGLSAVSTFWFVTLGTGMGRGFVVADAILWASVCGVAWMLGKRRVAGAAHQASRLETVAVAAHRLGTSDWMCRGVFALIAAMAVGTIVKGSLALPHGDWDAWAIWNQKARFLLRAGEHWTDALVIDWSHPAHPLLLPLSVARLWAYAGAEITSAPAMLGIVFGCAIVAVVVGGLDTRRPHAWIAGAVLLAPGTFVQQWTAQQADIPFAFFMVASLVVLGRASVPWAGRYDARTPLLLAGALAGLAAWTKNEGVLLLCVIALLASAVATRSGRARHVGWWAAGVAPVLLTVAWFKLVVAPVTPYYLPEGPLLATLAERFSDPQHRAIVDAALWRHWTGWGGQAAAGAAPLITLAAGCVALTRAGLAVRHVLIVPLVMLAGFYVVYLLTPRDAAWLIATTFDRLLVQIWPSSVLAAFFVVSPPGRDATP